MDKDYVRYIKAATLPVKIKDAVAVMGSKRRLAKLLLCANQTFTRMNDKGVLSPRLTDRWRAALAYAEGRTQTQQEAYAFLNALVDEA